MGVHNDVVWDCIRLSSPLSKEYGVYGDLIIIYPKPYSTYLRGTITLNPKPQIVVSIFFSIIPIQTL